MIRFHRLLMSAVAAVFVAALIAGGALASGADASKKKKSYTFTEHCVGKLSGTNSSSGTCTGKFGKSTYKVTITPPTEKQVETFSNGKVYSTGTVEISNGKAGGHFTITRGTGHYKGATGKGTYSVTNKKSNVITDIKGKIKF